MFEYSCRSLLLPLHVLLLELNEIEVILLCYLRNLLLRIIVKEALIVVCGVHCLRIHSRMIVELPF
jgi:hypothetical protein